MTVRTLEPSCPVWSLVPRFQLEPWRGVAGLAAEPVRRFVTYTDDLVALLQMNLQSPQVLPDVAGVSGLAIIDAILARERHPLRLAPLTHRRVRSTKAPNRPSTDRRLSVRASVRAPDLRSADCPQRRAFEPRLPDRVNVRARHGTPKTGRKALDECLRGGLYTALTLLAEVGPDLDASLTEKHFGS